jgi:5-bromo-4-chloroindolyl phosphate hydrolysis protein
LISIVNFILGVIFATIGLTLLDFITAVIANLAELVKGWFSVKIADYNNQILNLTKSDDIPVVEFAIP